MRLQPILLVVAGLGGITLGIISAGSWLDAGHSRASGAASPSLDRPRERRSTDQDARGADDSRRVVSPGSAEATALDGTDAGESATGESAEAESAEQQARARELDTLRARARAAQDELSKARERIARLEQEVEAERSARPARTRHEYDLTPEDWKKLAAQATVKYRVPCTAAHRAPSDQNLAALGLAPEDYAAVRDAFASSVTRQREALLPLCAAALDGRIDVARALNLDACLTMIFSTASQRAENPRQSARDVAAFMAGGAPRPDDESALTERAFLALAEESNRFEDDLAAAFGPDEAHHITFSDVLCFSRSSYSYGQEPNEDRR